MSIEISEGQRLNKSFFDSLFADIGSSTIEVQEINGDYSIETNDSGKFFRCLSPCTIEIPNSDGFYCYIQNISEEPVKISYIESEITILPNTYIFIQVYLDKITSEYKLSYINSNEIRNYIPYQSIKNDYSVTINDNNTLFFVNKTSSPITITLPNVFTGFNIFIFNSSDYDVNLIGESGIELNKNPKPIKIKKQSSVQCVCQDIDKGYIVALFGGNSSKEIIKINDNNLPNLDSGNILLVKKAMTLTLPIIEELDIYVKRAFEEGDLILQGESGTIDGEATLELANYDTAHLYCDGTNYYLL